MRHTASSLPLAAVVHRNKIETSDPHCYRLDALLKRKWSMSTTMCIPEIIKILRLVNAIANNVK
jgi:hypothetical protein